MSERHRPSMRTGIALVALGASLALCAPVFADGGQGQGRGGSFARGGGGSSSGQSAGRSQSAPSRSSGNFRSYRSEGRSVSGNRSVDSGRSFNGGRSSRSVDTPTFRANPRSGYRTTRPDFGADRGARPGLSTRPDMNVRPGSDGRYGWDGGNRNRGNDGRSNNGNRDRRWDFDRRPGFDGRPGVGNGNGNFRGRPGYSTNPGYYGGSRWHGGYGYGYRPRWHGGYWNGRFWPRVYYRSNFISFWPHLPASYATFWYGGISYYYVNDLYYTWSPARYGYVVTDPPPAAESTSSSEGAVEASTEPGPGSVFVYPRNGQSEEQTANDRFECHQWAVSQTGFDPTTATADSQNASSGSDYRRALIACLDARGYSAN